MDRSIDSGNSGLRQPQADSNGFVNRRSVGSIPTTGSESQNTDLAGYLDLVPSKIAGSIEAGDSTAFEDLSGINPDSAGGAPWTTGEILLAVGRLKIGGPNECWPAIGSCVKDGYGRFFARGRDYQLHRVILEGKLGRRLASDERARHTCDNPPCGNPTHLVAGSSLDNNRDSLVRDRRSLKLSPASVREIRAAATGIKRGDLSELARRYGVTPQYIGRIVRGAQRTVLPIAGVSS